LRLIGLKARLAELEVTPVARQWLGKPHMTAAALMSAAIKGLFEAVFSVWPAIMATSHYNKATAGKDICCAVHAEAM
jgi:hypothetical protein